MDLSEISRKYKTKFSSDLDFLLNGVTEIGYHGTPGNLCVFGDESFPLILGKANDNFGVLVAGARHAKGKIIAFGHTCYVDDANDLEGNDPFLVNAILWCGSATANSSLSNSSLSVGVYRSESMKLLLLRHHIKCSLLKSVNCGDLRPYDVVCLIPHDISQQEIDALKSYVKNGGGLLLASTGWGWNQLNPNKDLARDHPGNLITAEAGIVWANHYLESTGNNGFMSGKDDILDYHGNHSLELLSCSDAKRLSSGSLKRIYKVIGDIVSAIPSTDLLFRPKLSLFMNNIRVPKITFPIEDDFKKFLYTIKLKESEVISCAVIPNPAADEFPGYVPEDAESVVKEVEVNATIPGWHSTGLYAPPGRTITLFTEDLIRNIGNTIHLQIGCHTDELWHCSSWKRCPKITSRMALNISSPTEFSSSFGGLIYIIIDDECCLQMIKVTISGAVSAPYFQLGITSIFDWRESIRYQCAPWAELATSKIILTVPSSVVRDLEDPELLMIFWDSVMDAMADLAAIPRERKRPERIVTDEQISSGYMHSGYPIMTHVDVCDLVVNRDKLRKEGSWGHFHELGHNHQIDDWTFEGTGEVTCNLFTLYVMNTICGLTSAEARSEKLTSEQINNTIKEYLSHGASFDKWKSDPFLALITYHQLQLAFGWNAFNKVFKEYKMLHEYERPKTDHQKRDQWMVRFSNTVGKNLAQFFTVWGIPTSEHAKKSISHLPSWMPPQF